mmetsp:Transcript_8843/g.30982  ORF Transcript_8843/g.30982 Transcript_8843/m.30982 type:complete len:240 (+) Transcript_8843:1582-2301(+)
MCASRARSQTCAAVYLSDSGGPDDKRASTSLMNADKPTRADRSTVARFRAANSTGEGGRSTDDAAEMDDRDRAVDRAGVIGRSSSSTTRVSSSSRKSKARLVIVASMCAPSVTNCGSKSSAWSSMRWTRKDLKFSPTKASRTSGDASSAACSALSAQHCTSPCARSSRRRSASTAPPTPARICAKRACTANLSSAAAQCDVARSIAGDASAGKRANEVSSSTCAGVNQVSSPVSDAAAA